MPPALVCPATVVGAIADPVVFACPSPLVADPADVAFDFVSTSVSSHPDSSERPHALTNNTAAVYNLNTLRLTTARAWHARARVAHK